MTSWPRGPAGVLAPPPRPPPPGGVEGGPPPALPADGAASPPRRRRNRCVDVAEKANVPISCHDRTSPVARLRSSTRRGGIAAPPRPPWPDAAPAPPV